MNILGLLDELRTIACNGLTYTKDPYDRERYERLLRLACEHYAEIIDLPTAEVQVRLRAELGYITPKVGADAAIFDGEGRILLHQRADDHCWCLPCGWVDPNESPEEAVVREVREETGLEAQPLELVGIFTRKPGLYGNLYTMIAIVYLCEVTGGELTLSHEGVDLRYWPIEEVTEWHANHESYARAARTRWLALSSPPDVKAPGAVV
jgi:8-oxo-dGTP pyrophosphatase MutT (NUDIX family)